MGLQKEIAKLDILASKMRNTDEKRPLFIVNKILNQKKTSSILTNILPSTLAPSKFIALSKLKAPFEDIVRGVCKREEDRITDEFVNEERALLSLHMGVAEALLCSSHKTFVC